MQKSALKGLSQKYIKSGWGRHIFMIYNPSHCKVSISFTFLTQALSQWLSHDRGHEQLSDDEQDDSWASPELIFSIGYGASLKSRNASSILQVAPQTDPGKLKVLHSIVKTE